MVPALFHYDCIHCVYKKMLHKAENMADLRVDTVTLVLTVFVFATMFNEANYGEEFPFLI